MSPCTYLLGYFLPRLLESIDGTVDEGGTDLQHTVVVVHAATDVGDGRPLFYARHPVRETLSPHNLRHHQAADFVETLTDEEDLCGFLGLVRLHPRLA